MMLKAKSFYLGYIEINALSASYPPTPHTFFPRRQRRKELLTKNQPLALAKQHRSIEPIKPEYWHIQAQPGIALKSIMNHPFRSRQAIPGVLGAARFLISHGQ